MALAAVLRWWGLDYGIPHPTIRPDEERVVGRAQHIFATGNWHPGSFYYPSLPFYIDALALHGYSLALELTGRYGKPSDFLLDVAVRRPGLHYRIARAVSAAAGTLTVLAAFALSMAAFQRTGAALLVAFAAAVCHLHVRDSHFATVDVLTTFFVTVALVFAVRAERSRSRLDFALAGVFAGLAISSKYNAGIVLASIAAAAFARRPFAPARLALAGAAALLAFACTSPYVLLRFDAFWNDMRLLEEFLYGSGRSGFALFEHLGTTLPHGLGWPLFLLSALGLGRALLLRRPAEIVMLSFAVPFLALVSSVRVAFPRYLLPATPLLLALAVEALFSLLGRLPHRGRLLATSVAAALLLAPTLLDSIRFDRIAAREDTRLQAASFVSENFRPRSRIALCAGYGAPAINQDRRRPPAFVLEEMDCMKDSPIPAEAQFLITHRHRELGSFSRVHPALASWLEERASRIARFDPYSSSRVEPVFFPSDAFYIPFAGYEAVERGGPVIEIWKLPQARP